MEWYTAGIVILSLLLFFLFSGLPVAFAMLTVSFLMLGISSGWQNMLHIISTSSFVTATNYNFIAAPLFILMGTVFTYSGIGSLMCAAIYRWLRFLPGSLAVTSFVACAVFGAMSGSTTATTAAIGSITSPQMIRYGYDPRLATGSVVVGGGLGPIIPPSIFLIIFGVVAQISIGDLFIATIIPGLITTILLCVMTMVICIVKPNLVSSKIKPEKLKYKELIIGVLSPIIVIFMVLGSIYLGITTPVEAAGIGCVGSISIGFIIQGLNLTKLWYALLSAVKTTCMVLMLLIGAALFSRVLVQYMIPQNIGEYVMHLNIPVWGIMFAIMFVVFVSGFFIEGTALITILVPIFLPIIKMLNIDPILFGVAFTINLCIGAITPPFAVNVYVMAGIMPEVPLLSIIKGALWFMPVLLFVLFLVIMFPKLSLWLI
ncbi:MAG: TRAP transporter large permease [Desulfovermiculus sp.]|nr:TRAP transporter large permease [Desulfovermiculus sp.]